MSDPTRADDAALAIELVRRAGRLALRMRREGVTAEQKRSVSDVVTEADREAEQLVSDLLARERPDDGILGEEGASRPSASGRTWVVDPVDGTWNFVAGLDWWCSALALVEGDPEAGEYDVLLGAVHHPVTDTVFVGGPDLPTTRDGEPIPRLRDRSLATACVSTYLHPPDHTGAVGRAFSRAVRGAATMRMLGSGSMDATAIAQGQLHVSCQHSVPPWDRLPGAALVLGVGGAVRQVDAAGVVWSLAGAPTAVAETVAALAEVEAANR